MRQRREITARADAPLLRHDRPQIGVEHRAEQFRQYRARAGKSFGENIRAKQHHRAHLSPRQRSPDSNGMAAHKVDLQRRKFVGRDRDVAQFAEAGGDAVHDIISGDDVVDDFAGR